MIRSGATFSDRARRLVQTIYRKSSQQFVHFVQALVVHDVYSELGQRLLMEREEANGGSEARSPEEIDQKYGL